MITSAITNTMSFIYIYNKKKEICTRQQIFEVNKGKKALLFVLSEGSRDGSLKESKTNLNEKHFRGR